MTGRNRPSQVVKAPQIYLIESGEVSKPYEARTVLKRIWDEELAPDTYACIPGMKEWRAVGEALVWAQAQLIPLDDPEALELIRLGSTINPATVRVRSAKQPWCLYPELAEKVISTNSYLYRKIKNQANEFDPDVCDAFPAWELIYAYKPNDFPRDWTKAWQEADGRLVDGRMVAKKDDPVWTNLSDFGYPFDPFSFDSSMMLMDVDRKNAEKLHITGSKDTFIPMPIQPFRFAGHLSSEE